MRFYSLVAAAALMSASLAAHADTIINTFNFAPLTGYSSESGTSFAQFDPALGTLNSVTLNLSGTVQFSGGGSSDMNVASLILTLGQSDTESANAAQTGDGSGTFSLKNDTYSRANAVYIGSGTVNTSVTLQDFFHTSASVFTTFNAETLNYNYTPAVVVPPVAVTPEPSSLALLGTGNLGAIGVARKRFA